MNRSIGTSAVVSSSECLQHIYSRLQGRAWQSSSKGPDILRWTVIFRGKTCGVTIRAPLSSKDFLLVHKSRLLSILAPPSFPPFRSLKTRLQCRHLLLPSVSSSLPPTYLLVHLHRVPSFLQLWHFAQVIFPATLAPGQRQPSPGSTHQ